MLWRSPMFVFVVAALLEWLLRSVSLRAASPGRVLLVAQWQAMRSRYERIAVAVLLLVPIASFLVALPEDRAVATAISGACAAMYYVWLRAWLDDRFTETEPLTAAAVAELRSDQGDGQHRRALLIGELNAHLAESNPQFAFPLWRELIDDEQVDDRTRGDWAAHFAWALIEHYPDDPVPDECRAVARLAAQWAPRDLMPLVVNAFLAAYDGDAQDALAMCDRSERCEPHPGFGPAQVACIRAMAYARLGDGSRSDACREAAVAVWPECDMLPMVDRIRQASA